MPNYPKVQRASVDAFLRVYNRGGLHLLFDEKSRQAMLDFADTCLRSYVDDLMEKAAKAKAAREKPQAAPTQVSSAVSTQVDAAPVKKSSIILTDM